LTRIKRGGGDDQKPLTVRVAVNGGLLQVKGLRGQGRSGGGIRGEVVKFSYASRSRLLRQLAGIDQKQVGRVLFCTLTYPEVYSRNPLDWKSHLDLFWRRLRRRWPGASMFWRLEAQKRGAPHYHLLVFGVGEELTALRRWFSVSWFEVVGSGDMKHLRAGTGVELMRSWNGVTSYAAKYLGKVEEQELPDYWAKVGRWWGSCNKRALPMRVIEVSLTVEEFRALKGECLERIERALQAKRERLEARGVKWVERKRWEPGPGDGVSMFMGYWEGLKLIEAVTGCDVMGRS
jgi:hypothetical protein